jgi:hypothetical protein
MDASKDRPQTTAGLDLGDKYSYLFLLDTQSGDVIEEGRVRTTPGPLALRIGLIAPVRMPLAAQPYLAM